MQEFDWEIEYINGRQNIAADSLSRKGKEIHKISPNIVKTLLPISMVKSNEKALEDLQEYYKKDHLFTKYSENPV